MLETIRAFALEYLGTRDDAESAFRRHAEWFVALTESSAHELFGSEQADWLSRLEREHDNLRVALTWAYDAGQVELALRLTAAMQPFWYKHGHIKEGRRWVERARLAPGPQPPELRARILQGAGVFAATHDDLKWAQELAEEGLALYRQLGDRHGIAILLRDLGIAAARTGDYDVAQRYFEESAASFRELDERRQLATVIANIGDLAFKQGDLVQASERTREGLALQRELGAMFGVVNSLINLGFIALCDGRDEDARVALEESMLLAQELGSIDNLAYTFEGMAGVAAARMDWGRAARLLGRSAAISKRPRPSSRQPSKLLRGRTLYCATGGRPGKGGRRPAGRGLPAER